MLQPRKILPACWTRWQVSIRAPRRPVAVRHRMIASGCPSTASSPSRPIRGHPRRGGTRPTSGAKALGPPGVSGSVKLNTCSVSRYHCQFASFIMDSGYLILSMRDWRPEPGSRQSAIRRVPNMQARPLTPSSLLPESTQKAFCTTGYARCSTKWSFYLSIMRRDSIQESDMSLFIDAEDR